MGAAAVALAIKVTADARSASASIDSSTQKVSKLGRAGQVAGRLLAAGLLVAAGAAVKFTQAAADDAQAQAKLAATAQQTAGATKTQTSAMEDWISAQGKAKGVTDDELRPALEKLLTVTHSVSQSQKLASLAMDISARTGKSLESVTQTLAKAQTGSVAGLAKYGVQTKAAAGKVKDLASVQGDLAKLYGGAAAKAADTAAGKQKILSVQMGELQESIGQKLLPVTLKLTSAGLAAVDWMSKHQNATLAIIGAIGGLLVIVKAVSVATQVWSAVTKAYTAVQAALNLVMSANPVGLVIVAIAALIAIIVLIATKTDWFQRIWHAAWGGVQKAVGAAVGFIRNHWRLIISIIGGPIGIAVALVTKHWDKIKAGGAAVVDWVQSHWPPLKDKITAPFERAREVAKNAWDKITGGFTSAKETLSTTADDVKSKVKGAFDAIATAVQVVIDKVQSFIDKLATLKSKAGGVLSHIPGFGRVAGSSTSSGVPGVPFLKSTSATPGVVINFNGPVLDPQTTADVVARELRRRGVRLGAAAA
jgi:hypothetical protein